MKDLIKKILREEEREKKLNAALKLMEILIKGYEWEADKNFLALYDKDEKFVIFYIEQTINGAKSGIHMSVMNNLQRYLNMTFTEVIDFISEWCEKAVGIYPNMGVYQFRDSDGKEMAKRFN